MTYKTTYQRTIENDGGTFDVESFTDVEYGYSTGAIDGTYSIVPEDNEYLYRNSISRLMYDIQDGVFGENAYIGTWKDTDGIHIDPAIVFDNEDDCATYARSRNQRAYYSIHEKREVRL